MSPRVMLRTILAMAANARPSVNNANVSCPKAEKVVNAPRNPTKINRRTCG